MKKSKIIVLVLLIAVIGLGVVYRAVYRPHVKINELPIDYRSDSETLSNELMLGKEIYNKVVLVNGLVVQKEESGVVLEGGVYCQWVDPFDQPDVIEGTQITVKGRLVGYDDLLGEVKLDQCIVQKENEL